MIETEMECQWQSSRLVFMRSICIWIFAWAFDDWSANCIWCSAFGWWDSIWHWEGMLMLKCLSQLFKVLSFGAGVASWASMQFHQELAFDEKLDLDPKTKPFWSFALKHSAVCLRANERFKQSYLCIVDLWHFGACNSHKDLLLPPFHLQSLTHIHKNKQTEEKTQNFLTEKQKKIFLIPIFQTEKFSMRFMDLNRKLEKQNLKSNKHDAMANNRIFRNRFEFQRMTMGY